MGLPYYFRQAIHGVEEHLAGKQAQKAKAAEAETAMRNKLLGYQFLLNQQKQAQDASEQREFNKSRRDALLEGIKGGQEQSGQLYDELFGFQAQKPGADFGSAVRASQAERTNLPDVIAQGPASPAFVGPMQQMARTTRGKTEAELARKEGEFGLKQSEFDLKQGEFGLEQDYKRQQMKESESRTAENFANINKIKADTLKKTDKADIKDNISTVKIALDALGNERTVLSNERDKMLGVYKGRIPDAQMGRVNQIERRLAEIGVEEQAKMRRLDSLREGFEVPPIKPGRLAGVHESYFLISQMLGRRALSNDIAKKLVQDGRAKNIVEARTKANEYADIRDAAKQHLQKKFDLLEGSDLEEQVDLLLSNNPNIKVEELR